MYWGFSLLKICGLSVKIEDKQILNKINLNVSAGQQHVLMGPNGSGKSSLAATLMGHPDFEVVDGQIKFGEIDITNMAPNERAQLGIFLAFQYPKSIPGLKVFSFLKTIYESFTGGSISVPDFEKLLDENLKIVGVDKSFIHRDVNDGFSGGEKKRFEMLQLLLLKPKLAIIDEIDSGLDVDALKVVADVINLCHKQDPNFTVILITHYQRILKYLNPDFVHILQGGKIVKSAGIELAQQVEKSGYEV